MPPGRWTPARARAEPTASAALATLRRQWPRPLSSPRSRPSGRTSRAFCRARSRSTWARASAPRAGSKARSTSSRGPSGTSSSSPSRTSTTTSTRSGGWPICRSCRATSSSSCATSARRSRWRSSATSCAATTSTASSTPATRAARASSSSSGSSRRRAPASGVKDKPIERLWLSSMTKQAMRDALAHTRPDEEMKQLEEAAKSRSEADWIVGMNATRAATIRLRSSFDGAVSLGRVQTPTLAILTRREEEIRAFKPEKYWLVDARFATDDDRRYAGRFHEGAQPRLKSAADAEAIVAAVKGRRGEITKLDKAKRTERPPLLFDLTSLQREANTRFGFSARRTLAAAQRCYEEHKVAHVSADELALPDERHGRRDQADRRQGRPRRARVRGGREVRHGPDLLPPAASSTTRRSATTTRSSRRTPTTTCRRSTRTTAACSTSSRAASWPCSTRTPCSRTRASRRRSTATSSHPRPGAARAGLARRLRRAVDRRAQRRRRGRGRRPAAAGPRARRAVDGARGRGAREGDETAPRATPTRRCSARWRRPASSSTTTSCAKR